jgi:hypothetical protein
MPRTGAATLSLLLACGSAAGQCAGWLSGQAWPRLLNPLNQHALITSSISWDPDGPGPQPPVLVVGGKFNGIGGLSATNIASWDGASWHFLGTGLVGQVSDLIIFNGDLYAAGNFIDSAFQFGLARWLPASNIWQAFPGTAFGSAFLRLAVYNNELVLGGPFSSIAGTPARRIAAWNGSTWHALGLGLDSQPSDLQVHQGELFASIPSFGVSAWNGSAWRALPGLSAGALGAHDGMLLAAANMRVYYLDGAAWQPLGNPFGFSGGIASLGEHQGQLYAGGDFSFMDQGAPVNNITRWDGSAWRAVAAGTHRTYTLASHGPDLVAGGESVTDENCLSRWDGAVWQRFGHGLDYYVSALAAFHGELIAGGVFLRAGDTSARDIARWDGLTWRSLGAGVAAQFGNAPVDVLAVIGDQLVAGGYFATAGGAPAGNIASWDGAAWHTFGSGTDGEVFALAQYNGDIVAGGRFANAGGVSAPNIARWDGTTWAPFGPGAIGGVYALAVYNGDLFAAGDLISAGGTPVNRIARWNGSAWQPLGAGLNGSVSALAPFGGRLIVGGSFQTAGGSTASGIAAWDGAAWSQFGGGLSGGNNPATYTLLPLGTELIVGGKFLTAGTTPANHIARWDGAAWHPMGPGVAALRPFFDPDPAVFALATFGGEIAAAGSFTSAGGMMAAYWSRWTDTGTPWIALQPAATTVCLGAVARLTVEPAPGYDPVIAWMKDGAPLSDGPTPTGSLITGATTRALTISNTTPSDTGSYTATITTPCGSAQSTAAPLRVSDCACYPNCDASVTPPTLNVADFSCFLNAYAAGHPYANCDASTTPPTLTIFDFACFLNAFAAGCP